MNHFKKGFLISIFLLLQNNLYSIDINNIMNKIGEELVKSNTSNIEENKDIERKVTKSKNIEDNKKYTTYHWGQVYRLMIGQYEKIQKQWNKYGIYNPTEAKKWETAVYGDFRKTIDYIRPKTLEFLKRGVKISEVEKELRNQKLNSIKNEKKRQKAINTSKKYAGLHFKTKPNDSKFSQTNWYNSFAVGKETSGYVGLFRYYGFDGYATFYENFEKPITVNNLNSPTNAFLHRILLKDKKATKTKFSKIKRTLKNKYKSVDEKLITNRDYSQTYIATFEDKDVKIKFTNEESPESSNINNLTIVYMTKEFFNYKERKKRKKEQESKIKLKKEQEKAKKELGGF